MNRVLVVGMTHNPGGLESVIINYIRQMDHNRIVFDFLCTTGTIAYSDEIESYNGKIYNIVSKSKHPIAYKAQVRNFFKKNSKNYTAVWVNMNSLTNLDYLKLAKKYGIKTRIIHSHNSMSMYKGIRNILHRFNRIFVGKYATDFWACSESAGVWFYNNKILKNNSYRVINNAIDTNKYKFDSAQRSVIRKKYNIKDSDILIGHVGRFTPQKNHERLLEIFKELLEENNNYKLILIGDGELREKIENKADEYKIRDKIVFTGIVSDVYNYYSAMDLFLFPSIHEGLSVVAVEVQASGLPIVASDVMGDSVKVSDLYFALNLNESNEKWIKCIKNAKRNDERERLKYYKIVSESDYNIELESKKLEDFFMGR